MTVAKPRPSLLRLLPGFLISAAAIALLVFVVDWRKTVEAWSGAQLWVIAPAIVLMLCAMLTRAVAWRWLMGNVVPIRRCFWILNISYLINNIGFRIGDVARGYLISRNKDGSPAPVTAGAALSAVALERMFDLAFTCVLALAIFPMIAGIEWGSRALWTALATAALVFFALFLLGASRGWILRTASVAAEKWPRIRPLLNPLDHFLNGLAQVRNLRRSVPAFFWIILTMLLWAAEYWIVLRGFFPGASVYWGLLSLVGGLIGVALPSTPSSIGVFEVSVTSVLALGSLDPSSALAYALAIHMLNIAVLSALGILGLLVEGQSLGSILAAARSDRKEIT
ncbi:MAG: flippase-like domain-containing protein [Anaerolineales bacterium]|nr:flippase-like domain-containing protein [Anaerolineales bacterium]